MAQTCYCPVGHKLASLGTSRENGWRCDGRKNPGGCLSGITGFNQTHGKNRFRCAVCNYDLCERCASKNPLSSEGFNSSASGINPENARRHLITLNGHGSFGSKKFTLPENIWVLVPHRKGNRQNFTLACEEYETPAYLKNRIDSNKGWRIYKPGDKIHNQKFSPLGKMKPRASRSEWIRKCFHKGNSFCAYRWGEVGGRAKCRITIFKRTDLKTVVKNIRKHLKDAPYANMEPRSHDPIVLLPATCNVGGHGKMEWVKLLKHAKRSISDVVRDALCEDH